MDNSPSDFDRVPPQALEAEQSVLGSMLLSKDAIGEIGEIISGIDFYRPQNETIYNTILDLYSRGEPADPITVAAELERAGALKRIGGGAYLHSLTASVPTTANATHYARIVREKAMLRRLVSAGTRIVQLGYSEDGGEVDDLMDAAQAEVHAVAEGRQKQDYIALGEMSDDILTELERIANNKNKLTGVPTGFSDLDSLTQGLHPGQMVIIAARPAMGKSTLALDICRSAAIHNNIAAAMFSLEMSRSEIAMRLLSAETGVFLGKMRSGDMTADDWTRVSKRVGEVSSAPLYIDDSPNMSMLEIRSKCRRLKQQHNLGLVVLDYLQLMSSGKRVESRQQEVSEFSRSLKLLAKELELPVIAVAQLNRGPEQRSDHKPMMADLRESGSLEQDADVVFLLHRPDYYDAEDRPGEADIIVAKHRNGPTDTIPVVFQGAQARFGNLARHPGEFG
ncbi:MULTISPECIES: replicative DNA helicase [unclassified Schaalia]|uniref:replicative DNA helicase n=1 Tax=unclassified Schaalia TaxID=2691889 RepID=UPI00217502DC|nr:MULTISPECIES: replicative DNA helicase [unclassified Schaalia]